jgi:hypothetical protein
MGIAIYDKYGRYIRVNKKTTLWFSGGRKEERQQRVSEKKEPRKIPISIRTGVSAALSGQKKSRQLTGISNSL